MNVRRMGFVLTLLGLVVATACGAQNTVNDAPDRAAAIASTATATTVATVPATAVATVLATAVASPTNVSATELSNPTPGIAEDAACDASISEDLVMFQSIDELAWSSHQVVVGKVAEILPARKVKIAGSALPFLIVTDAMVAINQQFRGQPTDTVRVRMLGGSIGACSQEYPDSPQMTAGATVLLFLRQPDAPTGDGAFEFTGGAQGYWVVSADGLVTTTATQLLLSDSPAPLASIEAAISGALAAGPPSNDPLLEQFLVPASEAPIAPGIDGTPTAAP